MELIALKRNRHSGRRQNNLHPKEVEILVMDKDRYGRLVANVILSDGSNLNKQLVQSGFAWHYKKYAPHDLDLFVSQEYAQKEKLGLWADPNPPVPPWEWRRKGRKGKVIRDKQNR
jgi:micrococcal nuclease